MKFLLVAVWLIAPGAEIELERPTESISECMSIAQEWIEGLEEYKLVRYSCSPLLEGMTK